MGIARSNSEPDRNVAAGIPIFAELWLAGARQQPRHNLPIRIAAERDSSHRILSESFELLFGLSLVFRESHPLADDFPTLLSCPGFMRSLGFNDARR